MLNFKYTARDPANGEKVQGVLKAESEQVAANLIKQQGYSPLKVELEEKSNFFGFSQKVKGKDKVIFSRQLATLINAGLPLVQSLRSVLNQTKNTAMQGVVTRIITDVEGGKSFAESLSKHPAVFNQVFVSMVEAGEASGTLDTALERLANQQEKDADISAKVRGAMIYPIIVLLVMAGVVTFMLVSVLPQVEELYSGIQGAQLPLFTRVLLSVSDFIVTFWWLVILLIGLGVFFLLRWMRSDKGGLVVDQLKLTMWPVGPLFSKLYMARFARTGTTLIGSGVPLIQMLDITAKVSGNIHVENAVNRAADKVKGGKSLSSALEVEETFIDLVPQMLKIGEDSGAVEGMLEKTADYFEKEVDNQIKAISTIIEPVLMVVLGIVAITLVAAILLPIYGLVGENIA
jgi:type IV pilus assembly protein PilC